MLTNKQLARALRQLAYKLENYNLEAVNLTNDDYWNEGQKESAVLKFEAQNNDDEKFSSGKSLYHLSLSIITPHDLDIDTIISKISRDSMRQIEYELGRGKIWAIKKCKTETGHTLQICKQIVEELYRIKEAKGE